MLHPSCNPGHHEWIQPETIEQWKSMSSAKLDALVQIVQHHITSDNAAPLHMTDDQKLEPDPEYVSPPRPEGLKPDKIVIYSEFPSSNPQITSVS
jgi:hypothetical protein